VLVNGDARRKLHPDWSDLVYPGSFIEVGTSKMNNATIETFRQGTDNPGEWSRRLYIQLFTCHNGNTNRREPYLPRFEASLLVLCVFSAA